MIKNGTRTEEIMTVFIFFLAVFIFLNCGFDTSEGGYDYQLAERIIKTGSLDIGSNGGGIDIVSPVNRKTYLAHEFGNALFLLPTAAFNIFLESRLEHLESSEHISRLKQFTLSFQPNLYSALTAAVFFYILRKKFKKKIAVAFAASCVLSFATYFLTYTRNLFDGVLCSTLLLSSFLFLLLFDEHKKNKFLIFSFVFLGLSFITRLTLILCIFTSFVYLILISGKTMERVKRLMAAGLTLLPFFLWQAWYNHLRTGRFYLSPVQAEKFFSNNALDGKWIEGITGYFLSPGKSIFIYAPPLIISFICFWRWFCRDFKKEAVYVACTGFLWLLIHAKLRSWYGAWGWGPRLFITILPILFLPLGVYWEAILSRKTLRGCAFFLCFFGAILALSSIISNWHYRMSYLAQYQELDDKIFVWSIRNNQALDMINAAALNVTRWFTGAPYARVINASPLNVYASNTINIWLNTFAFAGINPYGLIFIGLCLISVILLAFKRIIQLASIENNHI